MSDPDLDRLRRIAAGLTGAATAVPASLTDELNATVAAIEETLDRKQMESVSAREQLARAARLAELGIMSAAVFHEMNQPLLGIKGFAELILEAIKSGADGKVSEWVGQIHEQALRMQEMQRNVANFLRCEEQPGIPVDLATVLHQALKLFEHRVRRLKVKLAQVIPDDLPGMCISQLHLSQILVNLVGNALDAMEGRLEGTLRIAASPDAKSGMVRILVADDGAGIPEQLQSQVFEPFFTTKQEKGTGLGLYIARTLAEGSQGSLALRDPAALGWKQVPSTAFELQLRAADPAKKENTLPPPIPMKGSPPLPPSSLLALNQELTDFAQQLHVTRRVLIVDDEPVILRVLTEYLAQQNILADVATTAEEGLDKLGEREFAVLLTDKNLPGLDGIELLKQTKENWPKMEVVVITGFASVESALDAIGEGAFDYIPKPFPSLTYVGEKVRGALARHDFEVRIRAMVDHLSQSVKNLLANLKGDEQMAWVDRLRQALQSFEQKEEAAHVVVVGSTSLANVAERLGHRATRVGQLEEAKEAARGDDVQVVVFAEEEGSLEGAEAVRQLHGVNPDVGVFVIAREGNLKQIVAAIGIGAGDYLVRPLEGREIFAPRLARLVGRQQRMIRYRRLLETLKQMNIDLTASLSPQSGV